MKLLWTGSDSLFLVTYPPSLKRKYIYMFGVRVLARIADLFMQEHYAVSENVAENLRHFGLRKPIKLLIDPPWYPDPILKKKHDNFNILYYIPKSKNPPFTDWLYGKDIYERLRSELNGVNWIVVDGSLDMNEVFPITDFYLRPNRHDGNPRLIMECEINDIPYYWSKTEPCFVAARNRIAFELAKASAHV